MEIKENLKKMQESTENSEEQVDLAADNRQVFDECLREN